MNKGLLYGLGAALLAGVGYGIYKSIDKHIKNELEKGFEEVKNNTTHKDYKTSTEEYVDELFQEEKDLEEKQRRINEINTGIYCFDIQTLMQTIEEIKPNNNQKEYYLTDVIGIISEKRRNCIRISCKR